MFRQNAPFDCAVYMYNVDVDDLKINQKQEKPK
jgi:hypothetical protein